MSKVEVDTIDTTSSGSGTLTIGSSNSTTITTAKTVTGNFKDIQWQSVVTADGSTNTTAEAGKGYIINTSSATHTINLPASPSAGDQVAIIQSGSSAVTVGRNSSNIQSGTDNIIMTENAAVQLVYSSDSSIGWVKTNNDVPDSFISATGGTETTSGNFKIHSFTSSGCFAVAGISNTPANNEVSYLVVAGGGGGGGDYGGGAGAGGFREGKSSVDDYTASPLAATTGITVTAQTYPITVGGGGTGVGNDGSPEGSNGSNSIFSTITSTGGGRGGTEGTVPTVRGGYDGGSGGGASYYAATSNGSGNTPPVSPAQGKDGGQGGPGAPGYTGGGGGGAGTVGSNAPGTNAAGNGGNGVASSITGSPVTRAGGGGGAGGGNPHSQPYTAGTGGSGGGGAGVPSSCTSNPGTAGTTNTGGGGGAANLSGPSTGGAGGSGVVIIRYKYQ